MAKESHISPILLGWGIAALIRIATWIGNCFYDDSSWYCCADCASTPGVNVELLALATGAGSLILSHVNDSGFWMIKEYFGMTVKETLLTWTAMETILSVVALGLISILNIFV